MSNLTGPSAAQAQPQSGHVNHRRQTAQRLRAFRQTLPIWRRSEDIKVALQDNDVLVLSGETGSGKSTQVPQFILETSPSWGRIAVTQPRRVAAISLAQRVADEMGSTLGSASPNSQVGYSVRFDDNTSPGTRIKFLTEGMLLRELLVDPSLSQYSCVIVDEVHERSVNVDIILGLLKGLLQGKQSKKRTLPLKLVVMSATVDVETIARFFETPASADVIGHANGGALGEEEEWNGFSDGESQFSVARCHVEGRQFPVTVTYLAQRTDDLLQTAMTRIFDLHHREPLPGDVLVFLTGQEPIETLQKMIQEMDRQIRPHIPKKENPHILVLPLYAALPQADQKRVFDPAPGFTRKIILSTNIAETSITVPGVRYVIDSGKAKVRRFHNRIGLESLLSQPISQSSADQRKGRAGREAAGQCHRLYTEPNFHALEKDTKPEILLCDTTSAILTVTKAVGKSATQIFEFPFLTPPPGEKMLKSLEILHLLGCVDDTFKLTPTGDKVAQLPLTPALGRVVAEAAKPEMDCLLEVIDIVACLGAEKTIFWDPQTDDERSEALEARAPLISRSGDHLTLLAVVRAYADESSDRKEWCRRHRVSHRAMRGVLQARKQLRDQCRRLFGARPATARETVDEATQDNVLRCFLWGSPFNIARAQPDRTYKTPECAGSQTLVIHPASFLWGRRAEYIMYDEFLFTKRAYATTVSTVQLSWIDERADKMMAGSYA